MGVLIEAWQAVQSRPSSPAELTCLQAAPERDVNPSGKLAAGRSWAEIRKDFDILDQNVQMKPLVYLDSAATSQKPQAVVAKMSDYYRRWALIL